VFAIAESPVQKDLLWAGTDDGLIHVSRDGGKNWSNVTPKGIPEWSLVSIIEASPYDAGTAYAAVDTHKLDDLRPYIFKTTDFGKTWTKITNGIPDGAYTHAVREDPVRKNLLYAGTETGVYVSFDGGGNWQSLRLNLPNSPIHDLIVKNDDLVVATHGRAFWILDDLTPLRAAGAGSAEPMLYKPRLTYRMRWPLFFERRQPVGENPPTGAIVYYYLPAAPKGVVSLEFLDASGKVVRRYSNEEKKEAETPPEWPDQTPPDEKIPTDVGLNRFAWDMRGQGPTPLAGEPGAEIRNLGPIDVYKRQVLRGSANTGLGGSSLGGLITLYTQLAAPGVFGRLLIESPSLFVANGKILKPVSYTHLDVYKRQVHLWRVRRSSANPPSGICA